MRMNSKTFTRREAAMLVAGVGMFAIGPAAASAAPTLVVHKDPNCGCCTGWVEHLRGDGFAVTVIETGDLQPIKAKLGVPAELAACHTAEIMGYTIEGHVPAQAIRRLIAEKPKVAGLAVPGMPVGSPGMEGGTPVPYDVVMFGDGRSEVFARFVGTKPV
jgi:hypothetical protein